MCHTTELEKHLEKLILLIQDMVELVKRNWDGGRVMDPTCGNMNKYSHHQVYLKVTCLNWAIMMLVVSRSKVSWERIVLNSVLG